MLQKKSFQIFVCFLAMFIMAVATGLRGLLVPSLMTFFNIGNAEIGLLFSISTAVSIPAAYLAGMSNKKYGYKKSVLIGILMSAATYYLMTFSNQFVWFIIGYSIISTGTTFIVIGLSTIVTVIRVPWQAVLVNMIHFFFGFGYAMSQKVAGPMIVNGANWKTLFTYMAVLYLFSAFWIVITLLPGAEATQSHKKLSQASNKLYLAFMTLALSLYVSAEFQTGNWLVNYLVKVYQHNEAQAGVYTAIFFGTFSVGRLLGGFIAEKFGYIRSVGVFLATSTVIYTGGMLMHESGIILIALSGFFFSLIYPTLTLSLVNTYHELKSEILSFVTIIANSFCLITSYMIGLMNDMIGIQKTFYIIPICLMLACVFFMLAIKTKPSKASNA